MSNIPTPPKLPGDTLTVIIRRVKINSQEVTSCPAWEPKEGQE